MKNLRIVMLKKSLAIILASLIFNLSVFAATPLERGTTVSVRLTSSANSKQKTNPTAIIENDVKNREGVVLIKRGTPVTLQIERKKAKGCGKGGYLHVKCVSTTAVDGQHITLEGAVEQEGDKKVGLALGLGIGLGLTFLPFVGFAFLAIKGEQAKVDANTLITPVYVMNDYAIEK